MRKTIFTSLLSILLFVGGFAKEPQKKGKVEEAVRYRTTQSTATLDVNTATAVRTSFAVSDIYQSTLTNGSNAQLEALGSRYAFAQSNSQLDELGSRYAFAQSNSQLDELGSRYAFAQSNSQLDELGSRYAFAQ